MRQKLGDLFWSILYVIEWLWNRKQLVFLSHVACRGCGWVHPLSELDGGLCPSCKAWEEEERLARIQKETAERELERFLEEEKRRVQEEIDQAWRERRKKDEKAFREAQSKGLL